MSSGKKFSTAFILIILLISSFVRFYQLGKVPNGLTVDEADMGYNAYSIIKTGADVYGRRLPLFFQSLDDYKAPFGIYAPIPAILIYGLNDFSVRLIPAILGSITPILIYFLLKSLYPKDLHLPLIGAVLTVFAPWNIQISRTNLPYIELIFVYLIFFLTFVLSIKKQKLLLLCGAILGLSLYVYYAAIIYLSLILFFLFLIYRKHFLKNINISLLALLVLLIFSIPAINHYQSASSRSRLNAISVLTPDITLPISLKEIEQDQKNNLSFSSILHNRRFVYFSAMIDNYFDYFNLDYLFVNAKNVRYFYVNNVGLFYLAELPFFIYGLYLMVKRRMRSDLLILTLFLIGPIPAMITLGSPFPHRSLLTILAIQFISAIGVANFLTNIIPNSNRHSRESGNPETGFSIRSRMTKVRSRSSQTRQPSPTWQARTIILILTFAYSAGIYFFLHQYFVHSPHEFTSENDNGAWFSTVREAIPKVNSLDDKYGKVVFTWSQGKLVPAVYFLFYNQINPQIIQEKAAKWINEPPSYRQIYDQVANIEFRPINWQEDQKLKNTLFIGYASEFSPDAKVIDKTFLPNGKEHFLFVETQ